MTSVAPSELARRMSLEATASETFATSAISDEGEETTEAVITTTIRAVSQLATEIVVTTPSASSPAVETAPGGSIAAILTDIATEITATAPLASPATFETTLEDSITTVLTEVATELSTTTPLVSPTPEEITTGSITAVLTEIATELPTTSLASPVTFETTTEGSITTVLTEIAAELSTTPPLLSPAPVETTTGSITAVLTEIATELSATTLASTTPVETTEGSVKAVLTEIATELSATTLASTTPVETTERSVKAVLTEIATELSTTSPIDSTAAVETPESITAVLKEIVKAASTTVPTGPNFTATMSTVAAETANESISSALTATASEMTKTSDPYGHELLEVTAAGVFLIAIVGTVGNILVVVSLLRSKKLRQNPSTSFMVNLPLCLIPVCALGMPMFGVGCLQLRYYRHMFYNEQFKVAAFTTGLALSQVHLHTICALAFNRMVAVLWPNRYKQMMKSRTVIVYLVSLWIYSALLWLPLYFGLFGTLEYHTDEIMVSMVDDSKKKIKKGIHILFTFVFPIIFTTTCYLSMYMKVRQTRRKKRERRKSEPQLFQGNILRQWDDHVTRTILVIYIVLITCSIPHIVIHILHLHQTHKATWLLLHVVFWIQFCIDPLIYVTMSAQYRQAVLEFMNYLFPNVKLFQPTNYSTGVVKHIPRTDFSVNPPASPLIYSMCTIPKASSSSSKINRKPFTTNSLPRPSSKMISLSTSLHQLDAEASQSLLQLPTYTDIP